MVPGALHAARPHPALFLCGAVSYPFPVDLLPARTARAVSSGLLHNNEPRYRIMPDRRFPVAAAPLSLGCRKPNDWGGAMGKDEFLVPGYVAFIGRVLETFRHDRSNLFENASVNQCPLAMAICLTVYGLQALGKEVNSVELVSRTGITRQRIADICCVLVEHGFLERYTKWSVHPTRSG